MRQLIWKEWHEQAWKLAFGCIVLSAMAAIGLHARMVADATVVEWVCFVGVTLLPVLSSTGLVPAERADGGLASLLAMPVPPRRVLAAKTAAGLVLCVGPLLTAAAVTVALAGGREAATGPLLELYGRSALSAAALFVWMLAVTVRLPSEARAALVAVGVLILWLLGSVGLGAYPPLRPTAYAASPFAFVWPFVGPVNDGPRLALVVVVQAVVLIAVWLLAVGPFAAAVEDAS